MKKSLVFYRQSQRRTLYVCVPTAWLSSTERLRVVDAALTFVANKGGWLVLNETVAALVVNISTRPPSKSVMESCDKIIEIGLAYLDAKLQENANEIAYRDQRAQEQA